MGHHFTKLGRPNIPIVHTKSQGIRPSDSGKEEVYKVSTIYGRGGHFGHVTRTVCITFGNHIIRSIRMKLEFNCPSGFLAYYVLKY